MHWTLTKKDTKGQTAESTLTLHPQFHWVDEFDWQAVVVSEPIYTITGAMIIETGVKAAGRSITLVGENVWLAKRDLDKLFALVGMALSLGVPDGRRFDVLLKKLDKVAPITAYQKADETLDDYWRCDIVFITI